MQPLAAPGNHLREGGAVARLARVRRPAKTRRGAARRFSPASSIAATKARRRAVHRRDFRPVYLDERIVDAESVQRRHQMLDGGHAGLADADSRAQFACRKRSTNARRPTARRPPAHRCARTPCPCRPRQDETVSRHAFVGMDAERRRATIGSRTVVCRRRDRASKRSRSESCGIDVKWFWTRHPFQTEATTRRPRLIAHRQESDRNWPSDGGTLLRTARKITVYERIVKRGRDGNKIKQNRAQLARASCSELGAGFSDQLGLTTQEGRNFELLVFDRAHGATRRPCASRPRDAGLCGAGAAGRLAYSAWVGDGAGPPCSFWRGA